MPFMLVRIKALGHSVFNAVRLTNTALHGSAIFTKSFAASRLGEFQLLGPRELNGNKATAVGPLENRGLEGCMAYSWGIPELGDQGVAR